jgi:hypothetical protein
LFEPATHPSVAAAAANFLQTTGEEEDFYCCKWTIDSASREPLLLLAGKLGLLRVVNCITNSTAVTLKGHGKEINDINVHPQHPHLVLTASKVWVYSFDFMLLLLTFVCSKRGFGLHNSTHTRCAMAWHAL